jgi:hypothetical protein
MITWGINAAGLRGYCLSAEYAKDQDRRMCVSADHSTIKHGKLQCTSMMVGLLDPEQLCPIANISGCATTRRVLEQYCPAPQHSPTRVSSNNTSASGRAARHPQDGHTPANVIPTIETLIGSILKPIFIDTGYRGHNARTLHRFKVFTAGQTGDEFYGIHNPSFHLFEQAA